MARASPATPPMSAQVARLFTELDQSIGTPDVVLYNASAYTRPGQSQTLDPELVHQFADANGLRRISGGATGGKPDAGCRKRRYLLYRCATASVKGFPQFAPFAMGKFALRGLTQSLARELGPKNIHVAHFVIDGSIASPGRDLDADDVCRQRR